MAHVGKRLLVPLAGAALLLPSSSAVLGARTDQPGYRVTLAVRLTSAAAGAHPIVGLVGILDDGTGLVGGGGDPPFTGELTFHLARAHLAPGAVRRLVSAAPGTRIGYLTAAPAGGTQVQNAIRVVSSSVDPKTSEPLVALTADIVPDFAPVIGATIPLALRITASELVFTLNVQRVVRVLTRAGTQLHLTAVSIYLFGRLPGSGGAGLLTQNPTRSVVLRSRITARPCPDNDCLRLGDETESASAIKIPARIVARAPRRATYGLTTRFGGRAPPGDSVQLAYLRSPGSAPQCTLVSATVCAPRYGPTWDKIVDARVVHVGADGRWALSAPLRSVLFVGLTGLHRATGRYVAVVFPGKEFAGPLTGGLASVFMPATRDTLVRLARPHLKTIRVGDRLRISLRVPGGDSFVEAVIRIGNRIAVTDRLDANGDFVREVAAPPDPAVVRATVRVSGAQPSSTSTRYRP